MDQTAMRSNCVVFLTTSFNQDLSLFQTVKAFSIRQYLQSIESDSEMALRFDESTGF